ncbi:hypothetical protein ACS0TY_001430 [Phlomoides rotata]
MATNDSIRDLWGVEERAVKIEEYEASLKPKSTLCLIGKVLTNKPFNAYGLLETMKKALKPAKDFVAKEVGLNLFSFQFRSEADLSEILNRAPWHFDKNLLVLQELEMGEQPSSSLLRTTTFWVRLYDLPMAARTTKKYLS